MISLLLLMALDGFSCEKLIDCIQKNAQLTDQKYTYVEKEIVGEPFKTTGSIEWTKENADLLLSEILNTNGYTRIPLPMEKTFKIINLRDIRYATGLTIINATKKMSSPIPADSFYYELHYTVANGPMRSGLLAKEMRPYMSRYGRAIDHADSLVVFDTGLHIRHHLELIRKNDIPVSKNEMNAVKCEESISRDKKLIQEIVEAVCQKTK